MKYFHLVWAALFRQKARTVFTLFSVLAGFLLFALLDSVSDAFANVVHTATDASRLVTICKVGLGVSLPESLYTRIEAVSGIDEVTYGSRFVGIYQNPGNVVPAEAVGPNFFSVISELEVPAAQRRAFENTRTGAVVGAGLAKRFHWRVGDEIPLQAPMFSQKDGSSTWTFDLVGIYHVAKSKQTNGEGVLFFNWKYFDEARASRSGTVDMYFERINNVRQADRIAQAIDRISANSDHETKTQSADTLAASLVNQIADVGLIVGSILGAVFFTLILVTGNTMAQAVRERIPEFAILKAIGFSNRRIVWLILAESLMLLCLGGVAGLVSADVVVHIARDRMGSQIPMLPIGTAIWVRGLGLMILMAFLIAVLPARRGMRLRIADALSILE